MASDSGTAEISLTGWEEFVLLPDAADDRHYELHDGELVTVPPARPVQVYLQSVLVQWLTEAARGQGRAAQEFPYRPAKNLQFWHADVAYLLNQDWLAMRTDEYPVYAPPLVIEVLSPSNRRDEIERQRVAAFSGGTREFWVVDADRRTIQSSMPGRPSQTFHAGDRVPLAVLAGVVFPVALLFE